MIYRSMIPGVSRIYTASRSAQLCYSCIYVCPPSPSPSPSSLYLRAPAVVQSSAKLRGSGCEKWIFPPHSTPCMLWTTAATGSSIQTLECNIHGLYCGSTCINGVLIHMGSSGPLHKHVTLYSTQASRNEGTRLGSLIPERNLEMSWNTMYNSIGERHKVYIHDLKGHH